MTCSIIKLSSIITYNSSKKENGRVSSIVNINELGTLLIEQVYITVCMPNDIKGPHMHMDNKYDRFYCIKGKCAIICRNEKTKIYQEFILNEFDDQLLLIPPYNSHAIFSLENKESIILSIPNEGFNKNKPYNQIETKYEDYNWDKWIK